MPIFGTVPTTSGEIMSRLVAFLQSDSTLPADWIFIGQTESPEEFLVKSNEVAIVVTYTDTNDFGWQIGGGNEVNVREGYIVVHVYRRSDLDLAKETSQSINNPVTGFNNLVEYLYKKISHWYPENSGGVALTVQPILPHSIKRDERQVHGFTRVSLIFHVAFLC